MSYGYEEARNRAEIYENHVGPLSQEIIAGAAGFFAMNRFEKEQRDKGQPENAQMAKELVAEFARTEAENLVKTKGKNIEDPEKVKQDAQDVAKNLWNEKI